MCLFLSVSPSRGGDDSVGVFEFDINQLSLPITFFFFFHSVLVSVSVLKALSTVFHSMNSPDNAPLSHSVLPVLILSVLVVSVGTFLQVGSPLRAL